MKGLRVFGNIIIGIILFALVFSLLFVRETNKIISSDVLKKSIKDIVDDMSNNSKELSSPQKEAIDDMFKDKDAKEIVTLILSNYKEYRNDNNYLLKNEDINKIYDFLYRHRDNIKDSKIEKMNDQEFKEYFNDSKIKEMASDTFSNLDKVLDSKIIDIIINGYTIATSFYAQLAILFVIILFIVLLCLINCSLIKWMTVFGVSLIMSGCLFNLIYSASQLLKELLLEDNISININISSFLFVGIIQIVLGIILIVMHYYLTNRIKENLLNQD